MKSITLLALFGVIQGKQLRQRFNIEQNDLDDGDQQDVLGTIKSPWKEPYEGAWVQTGKVEETAADFEGFKADLHGFVGNNHNEGQWKDAYERKIPENFNNDDDHHVDNFTKNVLERFATEGVTDGGKPNGKFFITKDQSKQLAQEVIETHLGMKGVEKDNFMKKHFSESWEHYDVNDEGVLDAMWASPFMRFLCKSEKDIDL